MKKLIQTLFLSLLLLAQGDSAQALSVKWSNPGPNTVYVTKVLYSTYDLYTNIPSNVITDTNRYIITTNVLTTTVAAPSTNMLMVPASSEVITGTNYTAYSYYRSQIMLYEILHSTNGYSALSNWTVPVSSNMTVIIPSYPGTNYFAVRALHTNLTDGITIYTAYSPLVAYPTETDKLNLIRFDDTNIIAIAFTPRANNFYTIQKTTNFFSWTSLYPFELMTNPYPYYYKEFAPTDSMAFFKSVSYPNTNAVTNVPPVVVTNVPFQIVKIYPGKGTSQNVYNITNVPAGALLVLTTACETDTNNSTIKSFPTLPWTKVDAHSPKSGDAELWTAVYTNGGSIKITNAWSANKLMSTVVYVIQGQESTLGGNKTVAVNMQLPQAIITTTKTNSIIIGVKSDWNGVAGTQTFVGTPVNQTQTDLTTSKYQALHWYKTTTAVTTTTQGVSSPSGENASIILYEVRSK